MNWLRVWWRGPVGTDAWRLSATKHGAHCRVWPVRFESREALEAFRAELLELLRPLFTEEGSDPVLEASSVGPSAYRPFDEFMAYPMKGVQLGFRCWVSWNEEGRRKTVEVIFRVTKNRDQPHVRDEFVTVSGDFCADSERLDFPNMLLPVELLIERHAVAYTRWDLIRRRPPLEFSTVEKLEAASIARKQIWVPAGVALVTSSAVSWVFSSLG